MVSVERRLAAILFTDVVGYTALMERDEAAVPAVGGALSPSAASLMRSGGATTIVFEFTPIDKLSVLPQREAA